MRAARMCLQVPYHPMVLMTWCAHMNIQRVTAAAWSFYLLKYTLKVGAQLLAVTEH